MKNFLIPGVILFSIVLIVAAIMHTDPPEVAKDAEKITEPVLQHVHGFAVDVSNPERLLIATHHGLLQFENKTFSQIGTVTDDLMGFTPHPTDSSIFYSSGHPTRGGNLGFQKSSNGGQTWQKISDGINGPVDFHSMTVSTVNPDLVYGHFGGLQHSTDGGKTWRITKGQINPYSLSTDPQKESVVYAATANGVLVSEDSGDTWKSLSTQLEGGAVSAFARDPENKYALVFSQILGGFGKSTDNGLTWEKINEGFGGEAVLFIAHSKRTPSTVYALSQSNSIYKSTDEGSIWTKIR